MTRLSRLFRACALAIAALSAASALRAQELLPFLAQSVCLDDSGAPIAGLLPFELGCVRSAPARIDAPLPYRRHDWPAREHAPRQPQGYQAQDAVIGTLRGVPAVIHGFDFGGGARRFGVLDQGQGDGGQVIAIEPGVAFIAMTEDGGGGVQWFLSPDCATGGRGWNGWLLAEAPITEQWRERILRLRIAPRPDACPRAFDQSLTRWRAARIALPWREAATGAVGSVPAEIIVSEHFGGASLARADHLERFFLARGLGLVRWERWENFSISRVTNRVEMAETIERQGRCPAMEFSTPPAEGWRMIDCRTWTNMVRATTAAPLRALDWPPQALR